MENPCLIGRGGFATLSPEHQNLPSPPPSLLLPASPRPDREIIIRQPSKHQSSSKFHPSKLMNPRLGQISPLINRRIFLSCSLIMLSRSSSRTLSPGCHPERYAMNRAVEPHRTSVVRESMDSDITRSPDPLMTAAIDFADWILFPEEEPEEGRGLSEMDEPRSDVWRGAPGYSSHPPTHRPRTSTSTSSISSSHVNSIGKNRRIRKKKTFDVAERRGVRVEEINSVEILVDRSKEEIRVPQTPRPQRLPTPDLSDIEQDHFRAYCVDPHAIQGN